MEDGALDVLAPAMATQKDVVEFRERMLRWIDEFNQRALGSAGNISLIFTWRGIVGLAVVTFRVSRRRCEMYIGHRLSVCLPATAFPH